jgi:hypothetical protein
MIAFIVRVVIADWLPPMSRTRQDILTPFLFAVAFTPFLNVVNQDLFPRVDGETLWTLGLFAFNAIVAGMIVIVRRMMGFAFVEGMDGPEVPPQAEPVAVDMARAGRPRLYARCGDEAGRIMRLTVDDHYVIAVFETGQQYRLLMRFADAVREMEGQDGFCTHRSHWVSAHAVLRAYRVRDRDLVELVDGTTLPVSRTYRDVLVSRGFLAPGNTPVQVVAE